MANRSIHSANMPAYNHYSQGESYNHSQPVTPLIEFKVCQTKRNQHNCEYIDSWASDTIAQLKEKVALYLDINLPLNKFFLEIFDEKENRWKKIDNSSSSVTIGELKLRPGSLLNMEYCDEKVSENRRLPTSTSISNNYCELTLKLCTKPMDRTDKTYLYIHSSSTLGKLRKQVYKEFNKVPKDQSIFVWNKDSWVKFDTSMDDRLLADLPIESYAFISIDYDENDYNSKSQFGLCGLANLGNTCFMNSVFQCLNSIPEFKIRVSSFTDEVNAPIIGEYIKLMKQMCSGKYAFIEPLSLLNNIKDHLSHYDSYKQQDAQEFMNHFLHLIHAEFSTKESFITELFYGQIRSTVKCLQCQRIEITDESISFLPLPISNWNQKSILYVKADGEQRFVSIQVNSRVIDIGDLIDCFVKQIEPTLIKKRIQAVRLDNNRLKELYETWKSLRNIRDEELAFIECPEKLSDQSYIRCDFVARSTGKSFRPPSFLVCPIRDCYYEHLSDQIGQLLGHLCSMTGASVSDCRLFWRDRFEEYELNANKKLPCLQSIIIEMDTEWVDIYKTYYTSNHSSDNSALHSLLSDFFREEPLDGDYRCLTCPQPTKARQKSDLCLPLPPILVIQLKRFTYDIYSNDKIDTYISFPLHELDLNEYIIKDNSKKPEKNSPTKYDLVAVSNHTGSLTSGHYTTYAKNNQDGKWYLFDDKYITPLDSDIDAVTKNAYILIYVQKSNDK